MMFDWNDQDPVGETIWGEFNENEDHIVPCNKDTEEHPIFSFDDCSKKPKNDDTDTMARSTRQSFGAKNAFPDGDLGNRYILNANKEHSGSRLDIDPWPDLPTINSELSTGELSSLNKFSPLAGGALQLDGESEFFSNACEEKDNDSFIDCDWANFGGFDDFDRIFRNETTCGHDTVTNVDDFLSSSADMIDNTVHPIPMPGEPLSRDEHSDQGCFSFLLVEHSGEKRKAGDKTADTMETREQAFYRTMHSNHLTEKDDRKKKLLNSRKKAQERSKKKASEIINGPWPQNRSHNQTFLGQDVPPFVIAPSYAILSPAIGQQSKVSDAEPLENIGPSAQFMYPQYGYPVYPFPGIPLLQQVQADKSGNSEGHMGQNPYHDSLKYLNSSSVAPKVQSKPLYMTPQEKIEKLRRRQQAHAMLAIQQQQQQFGNQITGAEYIVPHMNKIHGASNNNIGASNNNIGAEEPDNKLPPSAQNVLLGHDDSHRISSLSDDNSLEKTIYYRLQEALSKLDIRVRLCIRDSLFRLAGSSTERQNASDGSSTNKSTKDECDGPVNEEPSSGKWHMRLPDAEAYTNPIDRTVAHLLFHRPLESCTRHVNDEMPQSPALNNPASKPTVNVHESMSEREPEGFKEMELQPSESN